MVSPVVTRLWSPSLSSDLRSSVASRRIVSCLLAHYLVTNENKTQTPFYRRAESNVTAVMTHPILSKRLMNKKTHAHVYFSWASSRLSHPSSHPQLFNSLSLKLTFSYSVDRSCFLGHASHGAIHLSHHPLANRTPATRPHHCYPDSLLIAPHFHLVNPVVVLLVFPVQSMYDYPRASLARLKKYLRCLLVSPPPARS